MPGIDLFSFALSRNRGFSTLSNGVSASLPDWPL
jgi:hypothetical protein